MKSVIVIGVTGMVGQAVYQESIKRGYDVKGIARSDAEISIDIKDADILEENLDKYAPDLIINCAAVVDLAWCENNPKEAHDINVAPVNTMANYVRKTGATLVQLSSDQFYPNDLGAIQHREIDSVRPSNKYAENKLDAEKMCRELNAYVVRTNVTGCRGHASLTFFEWATQAIEANESIKGFQDFYTSTIDRHSLARYLFDLVESAATAGIYNIASSQVSNKHEFLSQLAIELGFKGRKIEKCSVDELWPIRCKACGLDVTKIENTIGKKMPDLRQVLKHLIEDRKMTRKGIYV